jgi:hypothetical protein
MPKQGSPEQLQQEVEHEVAKLRELAIKSTDPLIVAKAIAASDSAVQELILRKLSAGERLVEVFAYALKGAAAQVFFRFVPANQSVNIVDTGLLVFVDWTRGEVIGAINPYVLQPEHRPGRPFVAVSRVNTLKYAADDSVAKDLVNRQAAFFERLGVAARFKLDDGFGGIATVENTRTTETTFKGGRDEDIRTDETDDYKDCEPGPILA